MSEALAARGEEIRRGTMTADDLARQLADLKSRLKTSSRGLMTGFRSSSLAGIWTRCWLLL